MLDGIVTDARLAARALARAPGFTLAAVVVLAVGIGANTTVFGALEVAILSPPPYPELERLMVADLTHHRRDQGPPRAMPWSYPKFQEYLRSEDRPVDPAAGYARRSITLTGAGDPARVSAELVSPGYFEILGVDAALGRAFGAEEGDAADPRPVAVLSHGMWRERFGADPAALGRGVTLNGVRYEVVGVAPRGFGGLTGAADLWVPMATGAQLFSRFMIAGAQAHWFHVIGRLRRGETLEEAETRMAAVGSRIGEAFPGGDPADVFGAAVRRFTDVRVNGDARAAVLLLAAAAALVLLVACANLSGLMLARVRRRARDGAVRRAVGASRWRLVRASLVESAVLSALGGGLGVVVAAWGTRALSGAWPDRFLRSGDGEMRVMDPGALGLDPQVLVYALLVTGVTALLFGVAPAIRASSADLAARLKEGDRGTRPSRRLAGMDARAALVAAQVALALVLLVGTALVGGSVKRLLDVDEGFDTRNLLTFAYSIPRTSAAGEDPSSFHRAFLERIASLPGVEGVTLGTPPLGGHSSITLVQDIEGEPPIRQGEGSPIGVNEVGDRHFEMLGIPLLRGRTLDERDGTDPHPTLVLSRTAAETLFPGEDPVGRRMRIGLSDEGKDAYAEIVGVVGDVLYDRPDAEVIPEAYVSYREFGGATGSVIVRTAGDPLSLMPAVRAELKALEPTLAIFGATTMDDRMAASTGDRRLVLALLALFAAVTVLLAATGTWGIVAYAVADRRRELGLRMALGARGGRVQAMVLRQSVASAVAGIVLGLGGAWVGTRLLETFLYRTSARDPAAFAGGSALLFAVVLAASWLPARRATRVDPVEALRAE